MGFKVLGGRSTLFASQSRLVRKVCKVRNKYCSLLVAWQGQADANLASNRDGNPRLMEGAGPLQRALG